MPTVTMPTVTLDLQTVLLFIAVLLLFATTISTLAKGKRDWRQLSGAEQREVEMRAVRDRLKSLEEWRGTVDHRLHSGDKRFEENGRDTMEILIVLRSIIQHMQTGNDHAKLQETDDKLYKYLVEKRGVNPSSL